MTSETDKWREDLRQRGWREIHSTVWEAPNGQLYRGPYHAWQVSEYCNPMITPSPKESPNAR